MSGTLIQVLQFFASLSLLVLIHEFGHYITARIFGIRVEKFYLFFNPWFTLYKRKIGHTEYGIGWLPMGGYVSLSGMIDESMNTEQMKEEPKPWEFRTKPAWQRLIVMLAGIVMNILLAITIYTGIIYTTGESYYHNDDIVNGYIFNERAEALGFKDGDRIIAIDGEKIGKVNKIRERLIITDSDRTIRISRDGVEQDITISLQELVAMREDGSIGDFYQINLPFVIGKINRQ
jgi:regulator of sigma E protease